MVERDYSFRKKPSRTNMISNHVGITLIFITLLNASEAAVGTIAQTQTRSRVQVRSEQPLESPCSGVFSYETPSSPGRWYGNIHITSDVTLYGIWVDVVLDRQASSIGNWFGDVESSDNTEFKIQNTRHILTPGSPTTIRVYVVYDPDLPVPRVKTIRLNGRDVCSLSTTLQFNPTPLSQNTNNNRNSQQEETYFRPKPAIVSPNVNPVYSNNNDISTGNSNNYGTDREATYTSRRPYDNDRGSNQGNSRDQNNNNNRNVYNTNDDDFNNRYNTNNNNYDENGYNRPTTRKPSANNNNLDENSYNRPSTTTRRPNTNADQYIPNSRTTSRNAYQTTPRTTTREDYHPNEYSTDRVTRGSQTEFTYTSRSKPKTTTRRPQTYDSDADYDSGDTTDRRRNKGGDNGNTDYFEGDFHNRDKIIPTRNPEPVSNTEECGKVAVKPAPLIVNGQTTEHGQWPWHAALYQTQTVDSKYICGGSLVSLNHVITAAHCVTRKNSARVVNVATLTVYLGKFNLRKHTDGVQIMIVRKIHINPDYNATNFYADLSILKLTRPAEYTTFVRPVCLWKDDETSLSTVIGQEGSVVGWGFDEESHVTEELSLVKMPVIEQATCLWSFKDFYTHFTSNHSYCAGFANGTSVCNGDSGGGMVFPDSLYSSSPTWRLRGLVSISVARQNEYVCDPFHYVVFTDVAQFLPWIRRILT